MNRKKVALAAVITGLMITNLLAIHAAVDCGISLTYLDDSATHSGMALQQTRAILPLVAKGAERQAIVQAVQATQTAPVAPFEKDGYLWVGELGLKFDQDGHFLELASD
ncbi:MAG TPA: hypothetical protein VF050_12985 [Moraxellaceae bacterium]